MGEFINTIDELGDNVVAGSLIDKSITEFCDDILDDIGNSAFIYCDKLGKVDCPNVKNIGKYAFRYSTVTSVNFPTLESIGERAFANISTLQKVSFPSVTTVVSSSTFEQNTGLVEADFPVLVRLDSSYMFYRCSKLSKLILRSETMCTMSYDCFGSTPIASGTGYIYVPSALIEDYKVADKWSTYANQFRALEDYTVDGTITGELDETKI